MLVACEKTINGLHQCRWRRTLRLPPLLDEEDLGLVAFCFLGAVAFGAEELEDAGLPRRTEAVRRVGEELRREALAALPAAAMESASACARESAWSLA